MNGLVNLCTSTGYAETPGIADLRGSMSCIRTDHIYAGAGLTFGGLQNLEEFSLEGTLGPISLEGTQEPMYLQNLGFGSFVRGAKKAANAGKKAYGYGK